MRHCAVCDERFRLADEEDATSCDNCGVLIHKDCATHRKATFATPEGELCDQCSGAARGE